MAAPYFTEQLRAQFDSEHTRMEISDSGEELRIYFPSALDLTPDYVGNSVLIEFGGRNIAEPNAEHLVNPYIADWLPSLELLAATVTVLSPARAFWEEATPIHIERHRTDLRADARRQSRHWYDMALLEDHDIGRQAFADRALPADLVKHQNGFYRTSYANYDACHTGGLRLLPDQRLLDAVGNDLHAMINAGMLYGERPSFEAIVGRLRALQREMNAEAL